MEASISTLSSPLSKSFLIRDLLLLPWHNWLIVVELRIKHVSVPLRNEVVVVTVVEVVEDTNINFPSLKISFITSFFFVLFYISN